MYFKICKADHDENKIYFRRKTKDINFYIFAKHYINSFIYYHLMKITKVKSWVHNLELTRPYSIAFETFDSAQNLFVYIEAENGIYGLGAGSPAPKITGEKIEDSIKLLNEKLEELLVGKDFREIHSLLRTFNETFSKGPAACAATDIALHDLFTKHIGVPLVNYLGRSHQSLPTSITIGIKSVEASIAEADEYVGRGFKILKLKTGKSLDEDIERSLKIREHVGPSIKIRIDANQGYTPKELETFVEKTRHMNYEFLEQPLKGADYSDMLNVPEEIREACTADESLHSPVDALNMAAEPQPFGIYNIKLMKCGGLYQARKIADIAEIAKIDLMWGCMDESIVSIAAALHAALASPATKYIDLDGSLDLADDIVTEGFILKDGYMMTTDNPGVGYKLKIKI